MPDRRFAQALAFLDCETSGLFQPPGSQVIDPFLDEILEVAVLITDFDLNKIGAWHGPIKLTRHGVERLRHNPEVAKMHRDNGLLAACRSDEAVSLAQAEDEILRMVAETTTFGAGEFMIAGSGVAQFDLPIVRARLPRVASLLAYYPFDIGVYRRVTKILSGGADVVNPTPTSYQDGLKAHRAYADVEAHLAEAWKYRAWLREVVVS